MKALENKEVKERLIRAGLEPAGSTPEQLSELIKGEVARLSPIVKAIRAQKE